MDNVEDMNVLLQSLMGLGIPGVMTGIMVYFFNKQGKDHRSEREEWRVDANKSHEEYTEALRENTKALAELGRDVAGKHCRYGRGDND